MIPVLALSAVIKKQLTQKIISDITMICIKSQLSSSLVLHTHSRPPTDYITPLYITPLSGEQPARDCTSVQANILQDTTEIKLVHGGVNCLNALSHVFICLTTINPLTPTVVLPVRL